MIDRPPPLLDLDPLEEVLEAGATFFRCHRASRPAGEFNRSSTHEARFSPIHHHRSGEIIPTLYAADSFDGALSEGIFRDIPLRGPRRLARSRLSGRVISTFVVARPLRLVQLHGYGLRRLGISDGDLVESGPVAYPLTREWGAALASLPAGFDGLRWRSRQFNDAYAVVLFGDRVNTADLRQHGPSQSLHFGDGFDMVLEAAEKADITIVF